jgi:hypothetical protein
MLSELSSSTARGIGIFCRVCSKMVGFVRNATMRAKASSRSPVTMKATQRAAFRRRYHI